MNGNMIPEEWKENFRISERSFYILCEELQSYSQELSPGVNFQLTPL